MDVQFNSKTANSENIYLSDKDLSKRYGIARQSIWRWVADKRFPAPVRLTPGCSRWRLDDVTSWEAARATRQ